jgi:hypothetical protein
MKPLRPVKITPRTMQHIHSHPGRGHITVQEIREVLENPRSREGNRKDAPGDVVVKGQALNGKKLIIYVMLSLLQKAYFGLIALRHCRA